VILAGLFVVPVPATPMDGVPTMRVATPDVVVPGAVMKVDGEYLDREHVEKVFLTDGKTDYELTIARQSAARVEVKLPMEIKPGKFFLMVLTPGSDGMLIEQPVKVKVIAEPVGKVS
jgi:hypothetical protein